MPPLERLPRSPKAAPQESQAASTKTSRCSPLLAPPPWRRQKFLPSARACRPLFKVLKGLSGQRALAPGHQPRALPATPTALQEGQPQSGRSSASPQLL